MKILLITEFFPEGHEPEFTGGVEARTYFIVSYLRKYHQVEVIYRKTNQVTATALSIFPRLVFQGAAIIKALSKPADVIEGSNFVSYLPAFLAAKIKGIPAIAWYADVYLGSWVKNTGFLAGMAGALLERISLMLPWDQVIAMSKATRDKLVERGVDKKRIRVVYGGARIKEIQKAKVKKRSVLTIGTIARLVAYKRIDDLITAVAEVNKEGLDLQAVIVGEGPQTSRLKQLARQLRVEDKIEFWGNLPHNQVIKVLKSWSIFCLPSVVEGFGIVTIEAMAAGVPYVNSEIPATREITHGGKGGLLFRPRNVDDLVEKIKQLLTDKKLYQQKKREGLVLAKEYDWKKIAGETESVYRLAVENYQV